MQRIVKRKEQNYFKEFWAIRNISFDVKKGETIGIIGRNGAGKSTLLQIICGTLHPSAGSVEVHGRIAALLELGSGFNPEFTGRENIYMNASILGLSSTEIESKFADIISFADIGDFIEQPVKNYSSGMLVRLAFAVIAYVDADILVIDEALAVGDAFFQQKCMRFLRAHQDAGGTILFVTHDTASVLSLCGKALLLFPGGNRPPIFGDTERLCKLYLEELYCDPDRGKNLLDSDELVIDEKKSLHKHYKFDGDMNPDTIYVASEFRKSAESFGEGGASIVDAGFYDDKSRRLNTIHGEDFVHFIIKAEIHCRIIRPAFGFMIKNFLGENLFTEGTDLHFRKHKLIFEEGDIVSATFSFRMPHLIQGKYMINVALAEGMGADHVQHKWIHDAIQLDVLSSRLVHGYCGMNDIKMSISIISPEIAK